MTAWSEVYRAKTSAMHKLSRSSLSRHGARKATALFVKVYMTVQLWSFGRIMMAMHVNIRNTKLLKKSDRKITQAHFVKSKHY